ncbi:MAG: glycine cleavage T C-terminal barrel domain-containing protein, partial [Pseudomonadales bacterium]|nr:glycine cleavage T C-terminal barrel domain-containing protein [Pseudomonadales bacterium]
AFDDEVTCECWGNEAVYQGTELVGLTTGGTFGHRVGYSLSFAYIRPALVVQDMSLQVLTSAGFRSAHVELNAVYDPANKRLRE